MARCGDYDGGMRSKLGTLVAGTPAAGGVIVMSAGRGEACEQSFVLVRAFCRSIVYAYRLCEPSSGNCAKADSHMPTTRRITANSLRAFWNNRRIRASPADRAIVRGMQRRAKWVLAARSRAEDLASANYLGRYRRFNRRAPDVVTRTVVDPVQTQMNATALRADDLDP